MKREIVCMEESTVWENLAKKYPEDNIVIKYGLVLFDCVCDISGQPIKKGDKVAAVSVPSRPGDYYPWEHDYIEDKL